MPCRCIPTVIVDPRPPCNGCLLVRNFKISCTNSPEPCNDTGMLDLALYNNITACTGCSVVYSVEDYDTNVFSSVTVTPDGDLVFTTNNLPKTPGVSIICYRVTCPCSNTTAEGAVEVCIKNICNTCELWQTCDPCTGICVDIQPEISIQQGPQEISIT